MKISRIFLVALALILTASFPAMGWDYPSTLTNELTGNPINSDTTKVIILIHGWNPDGNPNCYSGLEWSSLLTNLKARINGSGWGVVAYDWHQDAATGSALNLLLTDFFDLAVASTAAFNAQTHGLHLAIQLNQLSPNLREVHLIAHSAGSWAARQAAQRLLQLNPYVIVQITLLDPFVPDPSGTSYGGDYSDSAMNGIQFFTGSDRIQRLENYFADDSWFDGWNAYPWGSYTGPTYFTQETFTWRGGIDINQRVDWGAVLVNPVSPKNSVTYFANYDWHAGPILFYSDCISASLFPNSIPSGLQGSSRFDYQQIGWNRSLYVWDSSFLPHITAQPANQSAQTGGSATFSVTASGALSYEWYKVGGGYVGSGSSLMLNSVTSSDAGSSYVVRVSNSYGQIYSKKAILTVGSAPTPTINSVSPPSLTTSSSAQTITIYGSNFTNTSSLVFYYPDNTPSPQRTPIYDNSGQLRYTSTFPTSGGWKVKVVNGPGVESPLFTFYVSSAPPPSATLTGLSISGPATVNENDTGSFTATALFSDNSKPTVSATWSVSGSVASINLSTGQLTAGSVLSDTQVTVSASYSAGGITKTASANVTIVNVGGGGGTQTQNLITNGDFELGATGWSANTKPGGTNGSAGILQGAHPHGGVWYAYLGDQTTTAVNAIGSLHQFITIPANATVITLNFYLNIETAEPSSTSSYDKMDVNVKTSSDALIKKFTTFSEADKGAYRPVTIDMSADLLPYKGQTVLLQFYVDTDPSSYTIFRIDDVSVIATIPAPVTLSSLVINGPSSVTAGGSAQYSATAVFSDGSTQSVTATAGWNVNPNYASISGSGNFIAGQVGSDTVVTVSASCTSGGVTRTATKDVTIVAPTIVAPTYSALFISGPGSINENSSGPFTAVAIFSDGSSQPASPSWSLTSGVASISGAGLLTTGAVDADTTVTVSASLTLGGVTHNANQNVTIVNLQQAVAPPMITSSGTASGTVGQAFSYQITASNSPTSYGASGSLPPGLSFNSGTRLISGTPTTSGTFGIMVTATNAGGTGSKTVTITVATAAPVIPAAERTVLTNLYASTNGASWSNNTNWNSGAGTECTWYGVSCDGTQSHVTGISLEWNNLVGTLPSLSGLTALQTFYAYSNQLSGSVPSLNGLTALKIFEVGFNQLTGSIPSLSGLTALIGFSVRANQLTGSIPSLNGLTTLQYFDAVSNQLTGSIPSLSGLTALYLFNVASNQLSGSIPSLSGLTALRDFYAYANQFTGSIPSLSGLTGLEWFYVYSNQLSGPIPSLSGLTALQAFHVASNQLSGAIPSLSGLTALQDFRVVDNQLTGSIPSLSGLTALQNFNADVNQLTGSIPALSGLTGLHYFRVGGSQLTGPVPVAPSSLFAGNSNLCGNSLVSSGNPAIDAAWVTAQDPNAVAGSNWLACQIIDVGSVIINPQPDAMNAAATWVLTDPNSHSQSGTGDQTLSNSPIGDYMIIWGDVPGWIKPSPASSTQTLSSAGTITFSGTYVQLPVIQVTQSVLNFGYVAPGSYKDLILEVKNIGGGILTGTVSACPPFSIVSGGNYSLGAGESQQVIVRYTAPLQGGAQTCSFVFSGGGGITIQVKGTNQNVGLPWLLLLLGN